MAEIITDEVISYISILAKLELSEEEREAAKEDMSKMLHYIDKLNELDTNEIEPMSHMFSITNVFRKDVEENRKIVTQFSPTPHNKDGCFKVPKLWIRRNEKWKYHSLVQLR
ncbi:MAG: Asp-tRNA(Asn)/Glu-tRNA(Gln) amidotransferase subunit GatC [Lachnospiraceae bacterium]